jgi:hypothetical protein
MIADLNEILNTVIYAPPPNIGSFEHSFMFLPTKVVKRKEKIEQLWNDIKQMNNHK